MKKNRVKAKIVIPTINKQDIKCHWIRPEFTPTNGIGRDNIWILEGLTVAIGFYDNKEQFKIIGSGIMIAPGLCLTATHVIDEAEENPFVLLAYPSESSMRIWTPINFGTAIFHKNDYCNLKPEHKYSDVSVLSCLPFSNFQDTVPHYYSYMEVDIPKIGERLWAVGYRELSNKNGIPEIGFFITSGLVEEQFIQGRGSFIQGACIQVAMKSLGGMSGGPVFNKSGNIVGVISTCLEGEEDEDNKGPTFVTLIWPVLISEIYARRSEDLWTNKKGKLLDIQNKVLGSANLCDDGFTLKFSRMALKEIHNVFVSAKVKETLNNDNPHDYFHELFEKELEEAGLLYLKKLSNNSNEQTNISSDISKMLESWKIIDAYKFEGLEDIDIISASLLESGKIGVHIVFDIRIVFIKFTMSRDCYSNYEARNQFDEFIKYVNDSVEYDYNIRPYFTCTFSYNPKNNEITDLKFHQIYEKKTHSIFE